MKDKIRFDSDYHEGLQLSSEDSFSKITSYSISYSVATLIDLIENQDLELEPEFQRNFVWDKRMASLFIDSLLIGFPTPNLFFGRNSQRADFIVIDGLQRLKTIYFFINGMFSDGLSASTFKLIGLEGRSWDGCSYHELPQNLQRRLKNSLQNATVIDDIDFKPEIVHELFFRINTGGIPLTNQEVRNCVYMGPFNRMLHELNRYDKWREMLGAAQPHSRLADIELILRILSLIRNPEMYHPPMHEFLSRFQADNRDNEMHDLSDLFKKICDIVASDIGVDAFRSRGIVKRTLLESVFVAIGLCLQDGFDLRNIKINFEKFSETVSEHKQLNTALTSTSAIRERIQVALQIFRG